jgi:putative ABC transport system permease protein
MALPISYNVRNLKVRWRATLLSIGGIALVVAVFVVLASMSIGFRLALRATGRTDNAIVVQRGSISELTSWVPLDERNVLIVDARVARGADGQPLASPEWVVASNMPRRSDGQPTNVTIRGVTPRAFEVRGGIAIRQGRRLTPGLRELIVGERIVERMRGLDLGSTVRFQRADWQVVGVFSSQGGAFESEVWGDFDVIGPAIRRRGGSSSLAVRMTAPGEIAAFDRFIRTNPQMQLQAIEERKYYSDQAGPVATALIVLAVFVSVVMGVGAVFGAMNTMYAIVAARTREIGTLRALGFPRRSILVSFVLESVLLSLVGGMLGCILALPMNGFSTGTAQATFAEIAFAFRVTPGLVAAALVFAVLMGALGGLLPAFRAARLPISAALREA